MSPALTGSLMRRARRLLRSGLITPHQFALLDCLVWTCRAPGADRMSASYRRLADLTGAARSTVADALNALEWFGLIRRIKRRVRVEWGGGTASRQATNIYVLARITESDGRPVSRELVKKRSGIEEALARLGAALAGQPGPRGRDSPGHPRGKPDAG